VRLWDRLSKRRPLSICYFGLALFCLSFTLSENNLWPVWGVLTLYHGGSVIRLLALNTVDRPRRR